MRCYLVTVVDELEVLLPDPQIGVVVVCRQVPLDLVVVVADHGALLEAGAGRALERHPAAVTVAQVVDLQVGKRSLAIMDRDLRFRSLT